MNLKHFISILISKIIFNCVIAQNVYEYQRADSVKVIELGQQVKYPWAGGLNYIEIGKIDLNYDGLSDLVAFENSGWKIVPFINLGGTSGENYRFAPEYISKFPTDLREWIQFVDYDADGRVDIFAYFSGSTMVYRNVGNVTSGLVFQKVKIQLPSLQGIGYFGIYTSPVDLPAFADIDSDGDIDVLTFNVLGSCLEYHRNMSMENFGNKDSLIFTYITDNWGNFTIGSSSNNVTLNDSCDGQKHAGGSSLLALDLNGDNLKDLVIGDIGYNTMNYLINGGSLQYANMVQSNNNFPVGFGSAPAVNLSSYPAGFYLDINNDDKRDLILSPNLAFAENTKGIWYYKNSGTDSQPLFNLVKKNFLQGDMIDVGEGAFPVLFDFDNDGLKDLLISNYGYYINVNVYDSRIKAYKNTGTASSPEFTLYSSDFGNLSSAGFVGIVPCFGDLDGDGDADMLVGERNGRLHYYKNTAPAGQTATYTLEAQNFSSIQELQHSSPILFDLDEDGLLDIIVGAKPGKLNFYKNIGTATMPQFPSIPTINDLGGVNVIDSSLSFNSYSTPFLFVDANDFQLFVGSANGRIFHYKNIKGNINGQFTLVTKNLGNIKEGARTGVAVSDLNADGKFDMVVGNYAGGVALYYGTNINNSIGNESLSYDFEIFPNPAAEMFNLKLNGNKPQKITYEIVSMDGKVCRKGLLTGISTPISCEGLSHGLYFIRLINEHNAIKSVQKVIIN